MNEIGPLSFDDVAHGRGNLRVIEAEGAEKRREAIHDDAVRRNLAPRSPVEAWIGRDHHDLVLSGQCPGQAGDIDLGAALDERPVEVADEADFHAAFCPSPARGEGISPTSDLSAAS